MVHLLLCSPAGMVQGSRPRQLCVAVIADNPATVGDLHAYLSGAGVTTHGAVALRARDVPAAANAVVLFPDELAARDVVARIASLRRARPGLFIVLVTSAPQRFRAALEPDGRSPLPVVLPRPAFGWTILDAIRAHASSESP